MNCACFHAPEQHGTFGCEAIDAMGVRCTCPWPRPSRATPAETAPVSVGDAVCAGCIKPDERVRGCRYEHALLPCGRCGKDTTGRMVAAPPAPATAMCPPGDQTEHFRCPTCGPHVSADEDGCCGTCGADTAVEPCPGNRAAPTTAHPTLTESERPPMTTATPDPDLAAQVRAEAVARGPLPPGFVGALADEPTATPPTCPTCHRDGGFNCSDAWHEPTATADPTNLERARTAHTKWKPNIEDGGWTSVACDIESCPDCKRIMAVIQDASINAYNRGAYDQSRAASDPREPTATAEADAIPHTVDFPRAEAHKGRVAVSMTYEDPTYMLDVGAASQLTASLGAAMVALAAPLQSPPPAPAPADEARAEAIGAAWDAAVAECVAAAKAWDWSAPRTTLYEAIGAVSAAPPKPPETP